MTRVFTASEMNERDYHGDPCADLEGQPSLSSSLARVLMRQPPIVARNRHPRLGKKSAMPWNAQTPAMRQGTMLHTLMLGSGVEFAVVEIDDVERYPTDWRKNKTKEQRDSLSERGLLPVLKRELDEARRTAKEFTSELANMGIVLDREMSETTILWSEELEHGPIWMRARIDNMAFVDGELRVIDLKTTQDCSVDGVHKSVRAFGYDLQQAAYMDGLSAAFPDWSGRIDYELVFLQRDTDPLVHRIKLDASYIAVGREQWDRSKRIWSECLHTQIWPSYPPAPTILEAPDWYVYRGH